MEDLDSRISALASRGLDRAALIQELTRIDAQKQAEARRGARKRIGTPERIRADNAREDSNRLGRILHFLHHGVPADRSTDVDMELCRKLTGS